MWENGVATFSQLFLIGSVPYLQVAMAYIRAWMSSKFGQIRSELAALEHLKIDVAPFSRFTVVVIPGKQSGERLQDHWSSGFSLSKQKENCI